MARLRLLLAYDGGSFRGFTLNTDVRTVAGVLGAALQQRLGYPIQLTCAGRTDAGVHAREQVVSLDVADADATPQSLQGLRRALNRMCGPEIAVLAAEPAAPDFDARFSALSRAYRYTIWNASTHDVFRRHTAWHVRHPLDLDAMTAAAALLVGDHDFASFCRRITHIVDGELRVAPTTRRVLHARWSRPEPGLLYFDIVASSFCRQMVRSIVGTLTDVGRGRRSAADMPLILESRDRAAAGSVAPPHGLCLWEVGYP